MSQNKKEAKRMIEFHYGINARPEKIVERIVVKAAPGGGPGKGKYIRMHKLYNKTCPKCGARKKNMALHDKLKHQGGATETSGWTKETRQVRELLPSS